MYVIARGETTSNMVFTLLASISCISSGTNTFPINALAMSTAISHFTLVMSQLAFEAFPAGKASALTILVISMTWAQHWTHACNEKTMRNHYYSLCTAASVFSGKNNNRVHNPSKQICRFLTSKEKEVTFWGRLPSLLTYLIVNFVLTDFGPNHLVHWMQIYVRTR